MHSVAINTKNNPGFSTLSIKASGELMKSWEAATVVDSRHSIDVAQDAAGNPIIFSIGSDNTFYAVFRDTDSHTGWNKIDLSAMIARDLQATTFGIYQNGQREIMLALAACANGHADDCTIYMSPYLSNTPAEWDAGSVAWKERPFARGKITVSDFQIGADHTGKKNPLAIAAVAHSGQGEHWQVNSDHNNDAWSMKEFLLPENAQGRLIDMAIGEISGHQGAYALYNTSTGKSIEFTTLPFKVPHVHRTQRLNYTFYLPGDINSLEAIPGDANTYDLYGAGDGVHRWIGTSRTSQPVAADVSAVSELVVRQDDEHIAIWLVQGDENLQYVRGARDSAPKWSVPLTLETQVTQIAALRNSILQTNELFTVKGDNSLSYFYQDPSTTLWQETQIPLPAPEGTIEFNSYVTHLQLHDEGGLPVTGREFRLNASQWCYLTVNHGLHIAGPKSAATITPDESGVITIINRAHSISTPLFRLSADWLDGLAEINPASKAQAKLDAIRSGDDLRKVQLPDGRPLLPAGTRKEDADAVGQAIDKMTHFKETRLQSYMAPIRALTAPPEFIRPQPPTATEHFGLVAAAGAPYQFVQGADVLSIIEDWADAIESVAGDVLHAMENAADSVVRFVVRAGEDSTEFFVQIGVKILKFTLDAAETVYRTITWLFKKIAVFFEDLIKWLGFLFNWDDILMTHKVLVKWTNGIIDLGESGIRRAEDEVQNYFADLKEDLQNTKPFPTGAGSTNLNSATRKERSVYDDEQHTPQANLIRYHYTQGLHRAAIHDGGASSDGNLLTDIDNLLQSELKAVINTFESMASDLWRGFTDDSLTAEQVLKQVGLDAVIGFLDVVEKLIVGVLRIAADVVALLKDFINAHIDIPVITWLYEDVIAKGSKLTVLDAISLLISVPVTVVYKLSTGRPLLTQKEANIYLKASSLKDWFDQIPGGGHSPKTGGARPPTLKGTTPAIVSQTAPDRSHLTAREASGTESSAQVINLLKSMALGFSTAVFAFTRTIPRTETQATPEKKITVAKLNIAMNLIRFTMATPLLLFQDFCDVKIYSGKQLEKQENERVLQYILWSMIGTQIAIAAVKDFRRPGPNPGPPVPDNRDILGGVLDLLFNGVREGLYIWMIAERCHYANQSDGQKKEAWAQFVCSTLWAISGLALGVDKVTKHKSVYAIPISIGAGALGGLGMCSNTAAYFEPTDAI